MVCILPHDQSVSYWWLIAHSLPGNCPLSKGATSTKSLSPSSEDEGQFLSVKEGKDGVQRPWPLLGQFWWSVSAPRWTSFTVNQLKTLGKLDHRFSFSLCSVLLPSLIQSSSDQGHLLFSAVQANLYLSLFLGKLEGGERWGEVRRGFPFNVYFYFVWILISEHVLHVSVSKWPVGAYYIKLRSVVIIL